jgi:hypothetical protein
VIISRDAFFKFLVRQEVKFYFLGTPLCSRKVALDSAQDAIKTFCCKVFVKIRIICMNSGVTVDSGSSLSVDLPFYCFSIHRQSLRFRLTLVDRSIPV